MFHDLYINDFLIYFTKHTEETDRLKLIREDWDFPGFGNAKTNAVFHTLEK